MPSISGVSTTGLTGTVTPSKSVKITGVSAAGQTGALSINKSVALTGVVSQGISGQIGYYYWSQINDTEDANWTEITTL